MKKVMLVILLAFLLAVLPYCGVVYHVVGGNLGNTAGNLENGALAAEDETYFYYVARFDDAGLYKSSKDFKETHKLTGASLGISELNVAEKYIYFIDGAPGYLQRITKDGKNRRVITYDMVGNVVVSGERIYYRVSGFNDNWGKVFSCDLNGGEKSFIADEVLRFCVDGEHIYYANMKDGDSLWVMKTSGKGRKKLADGKVGNIVFDEKYIYYTTVESDSKLFRMDKETLHVDCLNEEKCESINLYGDWIYYRNLSNKASLYRISKDGSRREKLADGNIVGINVVSNTVFYERMDANKGWYRLDIEEGREEKLSEQ